MASSRQADASRLVLARRESATHALRGGALAGYLAGDAVHEAGQGALPAEASQDAVLSVYRLQDVADYRAALREWFGLVRVGGHLLVVVPHAFLYERRLQLPSRFNPGQQRLYTPASLMAEVEEALAPNSYRVRYLGDGDRDYDYDLTPGAEPDGESDVLLALEKIVPPRWPLDPPREVLAAAPDYGFEPVRTRVETTARPEVRKLLILKLDHMGDFIMGLDALERTRALFPAAEITLVVGSWNADMARELGIADHVIAFDAFPRNSSEQDVDVPGKAALFQETVPGEYDLAIDLRTDTDTRALLKRTRARLRAGVGTSAQFPFLDIFLPVDFNRNYPETAREYHYRPGDFIAQGPVQRNEYRLVSRADTVERHCAVIWGPYQEVRPGRYFFEPYLEYDQDTAGTLMLDIGLDTHRVAYTILPRGERVRIPFVVSRPDTKVEFRIWAVEDLPSIDFSFYGGRMVREGGGSTLHQAEYTTLLVELVAMRLARTGLLVDEPVP